MVVDLGTFGMPGRFERLTIVPSREENYVVACLPFFAYGIHFGDLVAVQGQDNRFDRVLNASGLRTLRIAFTDASLMQEHHESIHAKIIGCGLPHEWHGSGYMSVLIRNPDDQERILSSVGEFIRDGCGGSWEWEVDPEAFSRSDA